MAIINDTAALGNSAVEQLTGEENIATLDVKETVDDGKTSWSAQDFRNKLAPEWVDRIGETYYEDEEIQLDTFSKLRRDQDRFATIERSYTVDYPDFETDNAWGLTDGTTYAGHLKYRGNSGEMKYYDDFNTASIWLSIADKQYKSGFANRAELDRFKAAFEMVVKNKINMRSYGMALLTIDKLFALLYNSGNTACVRHFVTEYNNKFNPATPVPAGEAATFNQDFMAYVGAQIDALSTKLTAPVTTYNLGGRIRSTKKENQYLVLLTDFVTNMRHFRLCDVYHEALVTLPNYHEIPYLQGNKDGVGVSGSFDVCSKIDVEIADDTVVNMAHCIGGIFDDKAVVLGNVVIDGTSEYNMDGGFVQNKFGLNDRYMINTNFPAVVFLLD